MGSKTFGEYVRRVMKQNGLSATEVALNFGLKIDRSHIYRDSEMCGD